MIKIYIQNCILLRMLILITTSQLSKSVDWLKILKTETWIFHISKNSYIVPQKINFQKLRFLAKVNFNQWLISSNLIRTKAFPWRVKVKPSSFLLFNNQGILSSHARKINYGLQQSWVISGLCKIHKNKGFPLPICSRIFCPYTGKYGLGKTRILAYFTQCHWITSKY